MLVCSVSQLRRRAAIAADVAEAAIALDSPGTGNVVFATLVDDPASVGEFVDAYLGEIMLEVASAADAIDAYLPAIYNAAMVEAAAADSAQDAAPAVLFTTFSSASAGVVLSNGNLTATHTNTTANIGARSVDYKSTTGKYYWEVLIVAFHSSTDCVGITTSAGTYANMVAGGASGGLVYFPGIDNTYSNGSGVSIGFGAVAGDRICMAFDAANHTFWLRKNGGNWNNNATHNPATNVGGLVVAGSSVAPAIAFGSSGAINDAFTADFGSSAFTYAVPSGFSGWTV